MNRENGNAECARRQAVSIRRTDIENSEKLGQPERTLNKRKENVYENNEKYGTDHPKNTSSVANGIKKDSVIQTSARASGPIAGSLDSVDSQSSSDVFSRLDRITSDPGSIVSSLSRDTAVSDSGKDAVVGSSPSTLLPPKDPWNALVPIRNNKMLIKTLAIDVL